MTKIFLNKNEVDFAYQSIKKIANQEILHQTKLYTHKHLNKG